MLLQPTSSSHNRDDNVPDESNNKIQSSKNEVECEKDQFDKDNYEMPIAILVNDEEVALPHAKLAQINDDLIIVDAEVCLITT